MDRRTLLGLCAVLAGCGQSPPADLDGQTDGTATAADGCATGTGTGENTSATPPRPSAGQHGYTHARSDGNRHVAGSGAIPSTDPVDVAVDGTPAWLVGVPDGDASAWAAVFDDGRALGLRVAPGGVTRIGLDAGDHAAGPPLLAPGGACPRLVGGGTDNSAPLPVGDGVATVRGDGSLALRGGVLDVGALPDARPVAAAGRLFVLADPTDEYGHGVLGDSIEAESVAVVDPEAPAVERRLAPPDGTVIEGIAPIVTTLDGRQTVIVTAADTAGGARQVALDPAGDRRSTGPPIGTGFRWRHQLAVAPFAPDGTRELAVVRTPHIGGVAEFYRPDGDRLRIAATLEGYSTHRIGSRNLDAALAGDFDGDGRAELLVPDGTHEHLAALRRTADGATEAWRVPIGGAYATNLAAVPVSGAEITLGVGREDAVRFWPGA